VRYAIALIDAVIVTVPRVPEALTPVRVTLTAPLLAIGVAAKGVSAKGEKPNIYPLLSFQC